MAQFSQLWGDRSRNVLPPSTAPNVTHVAVSETVFSGYFFNRPRIASDLNDLFFRDLRRFYFTTHVRLLAILRVTILCVVGVCTKPEMARIAASSVVAAMAYAHRSVMIAMRYFSVCQLVRYAMGQLVCAAGNLKHAVAKSGSAAVPVPAFFDRATVNFRPEAFGDRLACSHLTSKGSVVRGAASVMTRSRLAYCTAGVA
jgi:hypothetical protein